MLKRRLAAIAVTVGMSVASSANVCAQSDQSGYASVNGLEMYYETHGAGRPLVLLHGALMTIEGFEKLLPSLAEARQVIAIEQQAHGRTADIDRPFDYEQMADDTAALLSHLGIEHPGTTHVSLVARADWLTPMVTEFLDAPIPKLK